MTSRLEGKTIAITGGGRGIGRAIALLAAAQGANVVVADYGGAVDKHEAGGSDAADAVVAEIEAAGGKAAATCMTDTMFTVAGTLSNRFGDQMRSELAGGTYRDPANIAPLAVYLLGDDARDINGQVFRVQGYEIGRMGMISYVKTMTNVGPWDVDTIATRLHDEFGPTLTPLPMPWPEPKG